MKNQWKKIVRKSRELVGKALAAYPEQFQRKEIVAYYDKYGDIGFGEIIRTSWFPNFLQTYGKGFCKNIGD